MPERNNWNIPIFENCTHAILESDVVALIVKKKHLSTAPTSTNFTKLPPGAQAFPIFKHGFAALVSAQTFLMAIQLAYTYVNKIFRHLT